MNVASCRWLRRSQGPSAPVSQGSAVATRPQSGPVSGQRGAAHDVLPDHRDVALNERSVSITSSLRMGTDFAVGGMRMSVRRTTAGQPASPGVSANPVETTT